MRAKQYNRVDQSQGLKVPGHTDVKGHDTAILRLINIMKAPLFYRAALKIGNKIEQCYKLGIT
jgi:hypothetical protein